MTDDCPSYFFVLEDCPSYSGNASYIDVSACHDHQHQADVPKIIWILNVCAASVVAEDDECGSQQAYGP